MSHFRAAVRDTENTLGDLNIKYPQRHGDIDRVGTSPGIAQIASRLDELANLVRQRGPEPELGLCSERSRATQLCRSDAAARYFAPGRVGTRPAGADHMHRIVDPVSSV